MAVEFCAEVDPSNEVCRAVAALAPANPFYTPAYIGARRLMGSRIWILLLHEDSRLISGCPAFARSGYLNCSLEIPSWPSLPNGNVFAEGLLEFCRETRISSLEINSFASASDDLPSLPGQIHREPRFEYVLDLRKSDLWDDLAPKHLQSIKRARKTGLQVRCVADPEARREHARLLAASMERRRHRGESVPDRVLTDTFVALTQSGVGELFQAVLGEKVLSSALVLLAERGAYFHSAGTSPDGIACGASHYLWHEVANIMRARSIEVLNLGGADPDNHGLQRFKTRFGATKVGLQSAEFFLGSMARKKLGTAARLLRNDPVGFLTYLGGRLEQYVVYAANPATIPPPESMAGVAVEKLSDQALRSLPTGRSELRQHVERLHQLRFNAAYAVRRHQTLAHISWLVMAEHDRTLSVRNVKLRDGEAEITHCVTLPEFRGQGLYPFAIRSLCQAARQRSVRRVFMITNVNNVASQRGIEKAGFTRQGRIIRLVFPYLSENAGLTYRGHRWRLASWLARDCSISRSAAA
jgi:RimJ/RimL family protein N-acetyltransferase